MENYLDYSDVEIKNICIYLSKSKIIKYVPLFYEITCGKREHFLKLLSYQLIFHIINRELLYYIFIQINPFPRIY